MVHYFLQSMHKFNLMQHVQSNEEHRIIFCIQLFLTFLKPVPEGSRPAHGSGLLVQRHAGVAQTGITMAVQLVVLIGQAVVAQAGQVNLSTCCGASCKQHTMTLNYIRQDK